MDTDQQIYEDRQVRMKTTRVIVVTLLVVSGGVVGSHIFFNRPVHVDAPQPIPNITINVPKMESMVSADDCVKMCGERGISSFTFNNCSCLQPKPPPPPVKYGPVQIEKLDCNCACGPQNLRQRQDSNNDVKPQQ